MKFPATLIQTRLHTPLGTMVLASSDLGLALTWFETQTGLPAQLAKAEHGSDAHPVLRAASRQLTQYFEGQRQHFDLPLDLSSGTPFQQSVWRALLAIPCGHTCSYGEVAAALHKPSSVYGRAVGAAVGSNPLGIVVPCHRVIGSNGTLTGYAGGLDRKIWLLQLESGQNPTGSLI